VTAVAAIDCGTNSTRLLVVGPGGDTLAREMVITRLGEGVDREHRLSPEAIARTVAVLDRYRLILDHHGVARVRMTATSAARDAGNREEFFAAATRAIGVAPELLSGEEEGQLSFAGAVAGLGGLRVPGPYLVADIGGGSTELAAGPSAGPAGAAPRAAAVRSLDVGCVRLTERYLHHDPPLPEELAEARREARRLLEDAFAEQPALCGAATLIGLAGTVAALAAIEQGLDHYVRERVHHYRLRRVAVEQMLAELAAVPAAERRRRAGVEADRAAVIVGGAAVLAELMAVADQADCLTSESDILDGLAQTLQT
jgi:exopolyphosphatase/guanosine-5'-triphosphate,3'-diphosphate pyrophosphatase